MEHGLRSVGFYNNDSLMVEGISDFTCVSSLTRITNCNARIINLTLFRR